MNKRTKKLISDLMQDWEGVSERLAKMAERKASKREYQSAANDLLLADGILFCLDDLQKLVSGKYPNWTY